MNIEQEYKERFTNESLKIKPLPVSYIKKDFIESDIKNQFNYEKYLIEIVNNSTYLKSYSKGEDYHSPLSESNGENDCISHNYSLDFKLLTMSSYVKAKKFTESQLTYDNDLQATFIGPSERESATYYSLEYFIKNKTAQDIEQLIEKTNLNNYTEDYDITLKNGEKELANIFTKHVNKRKNLLFFYPYVFYDMSIDGVTYMINKYFSVLGEYRDYKNLLFDTFLTCILNDDFVIFKYENKEFKIVDFINSSLSKTFIAIKEINEFW